MSKRIALNDYVEVDGVDLSDRCKAIGFSSEHAEEDASGFSASGTDEFLAGKTTQEVTATFFMDTASSKTFQVLYPLHRDKSTFRLRWRRDVNSSVSATNPQLSGNVRLMAFPMGAERGSVETCDVTFRAADSTGLVWSYT